jgi:hypothetical protein
MFPVMVMLMLEDSEGGRAAAGGGAGDFVANSAKMFGVLGEAIRRAFPGERLTR